MDARSSTAEGSTDGRFDRQIRFAPLGPGGQERLASARVLIVGCGALGGAAAALLVRAGIGELVLVDRDIVEASNLPRQLLFEEAHARAALPKVDAAAETLARIGGPTAITTHGMHFDAETADELSEGVDLILDGTDNLATRYLVNDLAVEGGLPWIYAGVVGSGGLVLPIVPGIGPCLRCLFPDPPQGGALETCTSAGVLGPAVSAVASIQAGQALRLLARSTDDPTPPSLFEVDVWDGALRRRTPPRDPECPCCAQGSYPFLDAQGDRALVMCGRRAVQLRGSQGAPDFEALEGRLTGTATELRRSGSFLRFTVDAHTITVFPDGRALVQGTEDPGRAQALFDRYLGS